MPIQFHCKSCNGWIEVDDEYAGAKAACPYCQAVNSVPKQSERPVTARPAEGPYTGVPTEATRPGAPEVPVRRPLEESRPAERIGYEPRRFDAEAEGLPLPPPAARRMTRIGIFGLLAAIASIALMIVPVVIAFRHLPAETKQKVFRSQEMTPEQTQELQKEVTEQMTTIVTERPWLGRLGSVGLLLWVVSLVMNMWVIFARGMHRRTYAWAGLAVNTLLLFLCLCSGMIQRLAGS